MIPTGFRVLGTGGGQGLLGASIPFDGATSYVDLGLFTDYDQLIITFISNNPTFEDLLFGRTSSEGYIGWIREGTMTVSLQALTLISAVPNITNTEKGNGQQHTLDIRYTTQGATVGRCSYGGYQVAKFNIARTLIKIDCLKNNVLLKSIVPQLVDGQVVFIDLLTGDEQPKSGDFIPIYN